jgi:rhodanese-related sulfurtransferase
MDIAATEETFGTIEASEVDGARLMLVDVRELNEWDAGHAPDAVHVPLGSVVAGWVPLGSERPVAVICRSGARSARAAASLAQAGVAVFNVAGGMRAWDAADRTVVSTAGGMGVVL